MHKAVLAKHILVYDPGAKVVSSNNQSIFARVFTAEKRGWDLARRAERKWWSPSSDVR